ncbi:EAL domain-containing protein [Fundidesulfovibrio agrisoli]|uniref:EAL domain-containing protein n=1 Tax=Fundidesulfovibrio agrisoli TaxID=2922717 RepID=UPI001FAD9F04|nr:EAL domain-containing protein [Fundidesulfovibrio agrisoli]
MFLTPYKTADSTSHAPVTLLPLVDLGDGSLKAVDAEVHPLHPTPPSPVERLEMAVQCARPVLDQVAFICLPLPAATLADTRQILGLAAKAQAMDIRTGKLCLFFPDGHCRDLGMTGVEGFIALKRLGFLLGIDVGCLGAMPSLFVERLPADVLRLDPLDTLFHEDDSEARAALLDFSAYAANLLMLPAARGVHSRLQVSMLRDMGIQIGQGPLFASSLARPPRRAGSHDPA